MLGTNSVNISFSLMRTKKMSYIYRSFWLEIFFNNIFQFTSIFLSLPENLHLFLPLEGASFKLESF